MAANGLVGWLVGFGCSSGLMATHQWVMMIKMLYAFAHATSPLSAIIISGQSDRRWCWPVANQENLVSKAAFHGYIPAKITYHLHPMMLDDGG